MGTICELEQAALSIKEHQKEEKIGRLSIRMDYESKPGKAICNIKDGIGKIDLEGIPEMRSLIDALEKRIGKA